MAHGTQRIDSQTIDEEAARWAVRIAAGPLSSGEQSELAAWQAADPRHQGALIRARAAWIGLDRFAALSARGNHRESRSSRRSSHRFSRRWMMAAGLGTLIFAGASAWLVLQPHEQRFVSGMGEQRRVALGDGSTMLLNTATKAVVRFDDTRREVRLAQGEALFTVAKDPERQFVVRVGEFTVTAVGTAFAVRVDEARIDVTVTEGVVELAQVEGSLIESPRRIAAHQRALVTQKRPIEVQAMTPQEAERRLAWRGGMVAFDGESLSEAIAEVNRHSNKRIVVADPTLAGRPVVGIFQAADADTFARTAAAALGAEAVDEGDVIRLQASILR